MKKLLFLFMLISAVSFGQTDQYGNYFNIAKFLPAPPKGNGIANDRLVFSKALIQYKSIFIPRTTNGYLISGTLNIPAGCKLVFDVGAKFVGSGTINGNGTQIEASGQIFGEGIVCTGTFSVPFVDRTWFATNAKYDAFCLLVTPPELYIGDIEDLNVNKIITDSIVAAGQALNVISIVPDYQQGTTRRTGFISYDSTKTNYAEIYAGMTDTVPQIAFTIIYPTKTNLIAIDTLGMYPVLSTNLGTVSSPWETVYTNTLNAGDIDQVTINETLTFDEIKTSTVTDEKDTIDWSLGNCHALTLNDTVTVHFESPGDPAELILKIIHDASATVFPITWDAEVKWEGGTKINTTDANAAVDIVKFFFDGTNYYEVSKTLDLK